MEFDGGSLTEARFKVTYLGSLPPALHTSRHPLSPPPPLPRSDPHQMFRVLLSAVHFASSPILMINSHKLLHKSPSLMFPNTPPSDVNIDVDVDSDIMAAFVFPFLRLPLEIRNLIYAYVLVSHTGCVQLGPWHAWQEKPTLRQHWRLLPWNPNSRILTLSYWNLSPINLSLCYTSSQLYHETSAILWSQNTIAFETPDALFSLKRLHPDFRHNIRHIVMNFHVKTLVYVNCFDFLRRWIDGGNLKSVTFIASPNFRRRPSS
ncbi:hypothetical protein G7Y89_g2526 [Cudoniella acicularis]|uniref:DUF7730 domain-containing protein n=1 Tax=Cudoniella acicularis TaxID=354080 RepID=A0A8H4RW61_9HELO|nr:hypothetical protein G7Y89_g2526 [Cudoniella acicularis]